MFRESASMLALRNMKAKTIKSEGYKEARQRMNEFESRGTNDYHDVEKEPTDFLEVAKQRMKERGIMAKLEILLLDYTFNEDDGKLSFSEKRAISKHFKTYKNKLTHEDIEKIGHIQQTTLGTISSFIQSNQVNEETVNKALHTLQKICNYNERYNSIIKNIETTLKASNI